ncbi:MAG: permease-like cell division protein FtsX [Candidatus Pacebacteria bacterium]|nr:permease-like cell division protein FtsX [Candidatus Paceibacterota bacterium]
MFITNIKRIFKTGFVNFCRNSLVSFSAIFVMIATLTTILALILSNVLLSSALDQIKNKIDINVYTTIDASPDEIFQLKETLEVLPEVDNIEYISREQALLNFRERHRDDNLTLQALEELDENPLGAVLNIKAKEISQYAGIASFLESEAVLLGYGDNIIEKVNYYNNKIAIDKLNKIINAVKNFGFASAVILIIVSILITFNTIRLTIFISRKEIGVMRLVGANNNFIQGPFLIEGFFYGLTSAISTTIIFYLILLWTNPFIENMFFLDLLSYFNSHIFSIFFILVGIGSSLGIVSSIFAVRTYLKV